MLYRWRGRGARRLENRLVWIFGSPRSGSTWLLELLTDHEEIRGINEPLIGEHLGPILSDRPGVRPCDLTTRDFTFPRLARGVDSYFFSERYRPVWAPLLGNLLRERLLAEAGDAGLVAIKEPNGTQAAEVILGALPESRMIFLLRDGRDVVDSELAAFTQGSWMSRRYPTIRGIEPSQRMDFLSQSAYKWLWRTEVCEDALRTHPGPTHVVRYEDLRRDPAPALKSLFDWLGLELQDPEGLAARHSFERVPERGAGEFHRAAEPGLWRENLSEREQVALNAVLSPKLRQLGYIED